MIKQTQIITVDNKTRKSTKIFLKEFLPFIGVVFAAGFAIGVLVNIWCLSALVP